MNGSHDSGSCGTQAASAFMETQVVLASRDALLDYTAGWREARDAVDPPTVASAAYRLGYLDAVYALSIGRNIAWSVGPSVTVTDEQIGNILSNRGLTA